MVNQYIISIDGGTTNTRVYLLDHQGQCIAKETVSVGVRDTAIDGNNHKLHAAVRDGMIKVLQAGCITLEDVSTIYASGMLTSNAGLVEIPHLTAPVCLRQLARAVRPITLQNICEAPIHFIPGIKNNTLPVDLHNYEAMDIMRGEELEAFALLDTLASGQPYFLVLPGSHTKFIAVDRDGLIQGCITAMSGELLTSLTQHTILADAVKNQFVSPESMNDALIKEGYRQSEKAGLGRAAFLTRILTQFHVLDAQEAACYLLGVVLHEDVAAIRCSSLFSASPDIQVIVAGKSPLQEALVTAFNQAGCFNKIHCFYQNETDTPLSAKGAYLLAQQTNL